MANAEMEVLGAKELMSVLDSLPNELGVKVLKDINRSGAVVYRDEIESSAPSDSIRKAVKISSDRSDKTGLIIGIGSKAFWARFMEFGTVIRKTHGDGLKQSKVADRGTMPSKPFMQQTIEGATGRAVDAIFENMGKRVFNFLKRETRKANKKAGK